jgi:hypothetical protein
MPNRVRVLTVSDADRVKLERRVRDRGTPARVVGRARIVLLSAEGLTGPQIAQRVGCTEPTVIKTHKHAEVRTWLARPGEPADHPALRPTGCSWLNLVELLLDHRPPGHPPRFLHLSQRAPVA